MAEYRQIHTSIWKDDWFMDLTPEAKLLFIYLFSNEQASMGGLYKLPLKVIAFETGLDLGLIEQVLDEFEQAGKVEYEGGVVWVRNMPKYHEARSAQQITRVNKDVEAIADCRLKREYMQTLQHPGATTMAAVQDAQRTDADALMDAVMLLTGLMPVQKDQTTISEWAKAGVTEDDIRDALQWRTENGKEPVKTISGLSGGVEYARRARVQGSNGRKAQPAKLPMPAVSSPGAVEVYR